MPAAQDLAAKIGPRVSQLLQDAKLLRGVIAGGSVESPSDAGWVLHPADWPAQLSADDARRWEQAQSAVLRHTGSAAAIAALDALHRTSASRAARANAELLLLDSSAQANSDAFVELAHRYPDIVTDSGAPLPAVALLHALHAAPGIPLSKGFLDELTRQVRERPSFLTGQVLETAATPPNRMNTELRRLHEEWSDWQTTVDVLHEILKAPPRRGEVFQRWSLREQYLALGFPALGGSQINVAIVPRQTLTQLFSRALNRFPLPLHGLDAYVHITGERLLLPNGRLPRSSTITAAADGALSFPSPCPFTLILAADESTLFAAQRTRLWQMSALIFCAVAAALIGLTALWRGYQRQARLSELKSNFVSSVSHELRAPLGAVRLMAENLEREKIAEPAQQKEYYRLIGQECRRLTSLVESVLDFSRMEAGRKQYTFEPVDLVALMQHAVAIMSPFAAERGVTLQFTPPADPPQPCWDGAAIEQALVNLVDNAIKHSPSGAAVTLEIVSAGDDVRLWVKDAGPGIPPEDQSRIFDLFYRRGSELRRETTGAGIGLSIVKHVAEAHGGRVIVASEVGQGSAFGLDLPLRSVHV